MGKGGQNDEKGKIVWKAIQRIEQGKKIIHEVHQTNGVRNKVHQYITSDRLTQKGKVP